MCYIHFIQALKTVLLLLYHFNIVRNIFHFFEVFYLFYNDKTISYLLTGASKCQHYLKSNICARALRQKLSAYFNESQAVVYNTIRDAALEENPVLGPRIYFVDGADGNALLDRVRMEGDVAAFAVAPSGTAALLLKGGCTAHYMFKIPLDVTTTTMCKMTPRSAIAAFLKRSKLIAWDECSMTGAPHHPRCKQTNDCQPMSEQSQLLVPQVILMGLTVNMRVQQALQSNDPSLASSLQQFADYLLQVGQGAIPTAVLPQNMPSSLTPVPQEMLLPGENLLKLLQSIYFDILTSAADPDYFVNRCILTPKNKDVKVINEKLLDAIVGRKVTYLSNDRTCDDESAIIMPVEILNTIEGGCLPPHQLELKVGSPIMILRNIDPAAGLCNGTRLIVNSLGTNVIEATVSTGPKKGDIALIPRINFITAATEGMCPVDFQRTQFPIRLAFAMTINKAQGQTLGSVGLYLPCHVFGHDQLYVALSRVRTPASIKVMIASDISEIEGQEEKYTNNVVFREVFL